MLGQWPHYLMFRQRILLAEIWVDPVCPGTLDDQAHCERLKDFYQIRAVSRDLWLTYECAIPPP